MPVKSGTKRAKVNSKTAETYRHPESESLMRPEVGTRAQFKKKVRRRSIGLATPCRLCWSGMGRIRGVSAASHIWQPPSPSFEAQTTHELA